MAWDSAGEDGGRKPLDSSCMHTAAGSANSGILREACSCASQYGVCTYIYIYMYVHISIYATGTARCVGSDIGGCRWGD